MLKRKPLSEKLFVQHTSLKAARRLLDENNVVGLYGPCGSGKTELALQIVKVCKSKSDIVSAVFTCDEWTSVQLGMREFSGFRDLPLKSLGDDNLVGILQEMYTNLNERFPDRCKVLVFDDVEPPTSIMDAVDQTILAPLSRLPKDDILKNTWKIVFTTQSLQEDGMKHWDNLHKENFLRVDGFEDEELKMFFKQGERRRILTQIELDDIKDRLGCHPLRLQAFRSGMHPSKSVVESLNTFMESIEHLTKDNEDVAAQYINLKRLFEQSEYGKEYKDLVILLSMFYCSNFTWELLASCAEAALPDHSVDRMKTLIKELTDRASCHAPDPFINDKSLLSFHKVVMRAMSLFLPDGQIENWTWKALLALTRVMPRDGRGHQSHVIYGYMYNHACALVAKVNPLLYADEINRDKNACIMLWMCNLQMEMGYCLHALRLNASKANENINDALDWFTRLSVDMKTSYGDLKVEEPKGLVHTQKATSLFNRITGAQSPMRDSRRFAEMMYQVPRFLRLTKRDIHILFDSSDEHFPNNHLQESQLTKLIEEQRALEPDKLKEFYAAELLAEIFATAAKAWAFHRDDGKFAECMEFAAAAKEIYESIKAKFSVRLMAEVITEREMLKMQVEFMGDELGDLEHLEKQWEVLQSTTGKAFEYGLMRADFANDPYNRFLCKEGLTTCEGRKCAILADDAIFAQVNTAFIELIGMTQDKDPKMQMNYQTTSKAYRNHGNFLWRCGSYQEAVKAMLEAFIRLNYFLCGNEELSSFPELHESCGKAKFLLKFLNKFFKSYKENSSAERLLHRDESDQHLLDYVTKLVKVWDEERSRQPKEFGVMQEILNASP